MNIYIHHDNQQIGPFPLESVREMVRAGSLPETALAWHEGALDWVPLSTLLAHGAAATQVHPVTPRLLPKAAPTHERDALATDLRLLLQTAGAALAFAIVAGVVWAAFYCRTGFQLPLIIGVVIGYFCGFVVDKASHGTGGFLYVGLAIGACALAWFIGVIGPAFFGHPVGIGLWTLAGFVFAAAVAWRNAAL